MYVCTYIAVYIDNTQQAVNHSASSAINQLENYSITTVTIQYTIYEGAPDGKAERCQLQLNSRKIFVGLQASDIQCK